VSAADRWGRRRARPDFFIVGVARSGTTLARAILTGHPDVQVPAETGFLPKLVRARPSWWGKKGVRSELFVRLAFANGRLAAAGLEPRHLLLALAQRPPTRPVEAISVIYELATHNENAEHIGDKTPGYERHVQLLWDAFPHARFIHLVRHPLDVVASLRHQPWGPSDPLAAGMLWLRSIRACTSATVPAESMLLVRLEDLVSNPVRTVDRMSHHLGVTPHPQMLRFPQRAEAIRQQNLHPAGHDGLSRPLRTTRAWEQELSDRDAARAWSLVASAARPLGYDGPEGASKVAESDAVVRLARFQTAQSWRRGRTLMRLLHP